METLNGDSMMFELPRLDRADQLAGRLVVYLDQNKWRLVSDAMRGQRSGTADDRVAALRLASGIEETDRQDGLNNAPAAVVPLLDLAGSWVRLGEGFVPHNSEPSKEQKSQGAKGGARMLATLHHLLQTFPGLALRARRMLNAAYARTGDEGRDLPALDVDPDVESFTGWSRRDAMGHRDETVPGGVRTVESLAQGIAGLGPTAGVARFVALVERSELAGHHGGGTWVADQMVPRLTDPAAWLAAATAASCPPIHRAALSRWLATSPDVGNIIRG